MLERPRGRRVALTLLSGGAALLTAGAATAAAATAPTFDVVRTGATSAQADALASALGVPTPIRDAEGSLSFLDKDRFGFLPSRPVTDPDATKPDEEGTPVIAQAPDFDAIKRLKVISAATARSKATAALRGAGLEFTGTGTVTNSRFESRDAAGTVLNVPVDTHVSFPVTLAGHRLIGAGSKSKLVFDGQGRVTFLRYAARQLRQGANVALIPPAEADQIASGRFRSSCPGVQPLANVRLSRELVYLAPDLTQRVTKIVPHYAYTGTAQVAGKAVNLEGIVIPATRQAAPQATVTLSGTGPALRATTKVQGGTGPFTYRYSSCATQLPEAARTGGPTIDYTVRARRGGGGAADEQLTVTVTDANGLTSTAVARADVLARAARRPARARMASGSVIDTSSEGIGTSQGLGNTEDNTRKFREEMDDVSAIPFSFMDDDVWDSDFTDPAFGGNDSTYADNVDLMWAQGHGNVNGFATSPTVGDGWVDRTDTALGTVDLEWLVIHACNTLQLTSSSGHLWDRWLQAFDGLHLLMGFGTTAFNVSGDGNDFGDSLADDGQKVRDAWVEAAEDQQPNGVTYRYMGVYGPSGEWNREDYFHGQGSVSADIRTVTGAWSYSGTT